MKKLHKHNIKYFLIFAIALFSFSLSTDKVIGISDGDTIKILRSPRVNLKIRLNGIDCPESHQAYGQKAKEFTAAACFQKDVRLVTLGKDRYGRTIADVYLPDGKMLNQELVRHGLAWHYKKYSSDTTLSRLENEARKNKVGLWADKDPIAPWLFRKQNK